MDFKQSGKKKAITFSFDDAVTQDIKLIELLNKYDLKCTFNLNSQALGCRGHLIREGQRISHYKIHPDDVKFIYEGHEVAGHTLTHPFLPSLEDDVVIREVEKDRLALSDIVGYEVVGFAYPCGGENNDDRVAKLIKENTGVKYARTITSTGNFDPQENLYRFNPSVYYMDGFDTLMDLGKKFLDLDADSPQIFYVWGHSYELDYRADAWVKLEEFFKLIANKDDIFYGTNKEILL